ELRGRGERGDDLVVAALWLQVRGHVITVKRLHRVLLKAPDAIVPADHDHRQSVPDQGVDVHQGEPGGAVTEQQDDLSLRAGDPGRYRVAEAGTQAPVGPGIQPAARLTR